MRWGFRMNKTKATQKYRVAEIRRLSSEGLSISKIAKMLGIEYKLATRLKTLGGDK